MFFRRAPRRITAPPAPMPYPGYTTQKLEWGAPIWIFMHTLSAKIKPDCYLELRDSLWTMLERICQNLPCPDCSAHATEYIRNIRKHTLSTSAEFEWMLFVFHNTVNARKLVPLFSEDSFHTLYSEKRWDEVFPPFMKTMQYSYGSMLNMMHNDSRKMLTKNIVDWFRQNRHCFYD